MRNIHFPFYVQTDTSVAVAREMVEELDLTDQDVIDIAQMIDLEIQSLIPDWTPSFMDKNYYSPDREHSVNLASETIVEYSPMVNDAGYSPSNIIVERTSYGRKYWCDSPMVVGSSTSPTLGAPSNLLALDYSVAEEKTFARDGEVLNDLNSSSLNKNLENEINISSIAHPSLRWLFDSTNSGNTSSVENHEELPAGQKREIVVRRDRQKKDIVVHFGKFLQKFGKRFQICFT